MVKKIEKQKEQAPVSFPRYRHSFSMRTLKVPASTVPETVTQIYLKKAEKWINIEKHRSNDLDYQFHNTITHLPYLYKDYSFRSS